MNYRVAFVTTTWNWISVVTIAVSFLMYVVFLAVYCLWEWFDPHMYKVVYHMVNHLLFWFGAVAVPALAMMVDVFKSYLCLEVFPDQADLVPIHIIQLGAL